MGLWERKWKRTSEIIGKGEEAEVGGELQKWREGGETEKESLREELRMSINERAPL